MTTSDKERPEDTGKPGDPPADDVEDQDAEPSLNAPGDEGPDGVTAPDEE